MPMGPKLPKAEALAEIVRKHGDREELRNAARKTRWLLAHAYMRGERVFNLYDPNNVKLGILSLREDHKMPLQLGEMLSSMNRVLSAFMGLDLRAQVLPQGESLASIQDRAIMQAIMNSLVDEHQLELQKVKFLQTLFLLGSCGVMQRVSNHEVVGLTSDVEIIHPWELMPFPSIDFDYNKQNGTMRQHLVPIERVKAEFGKKIGRNMPELEIFRKETGEAVEREAVGGVGAAVHEPVRGKDVRKGDTETLFVKVRELWLDGARGTCDRYAIASGNYLIEDVDFREMGAEVYCPVGWARAFETGDPHGAGLFDMLFSAVREFEFLVEDLANNARDAEKLPVVIAPAGELNERKLFAQGPGNPGMKLVTIRPERNYAGSRDVRPTVVQPVNTGDMPGRTAAFLKDIIRDLTPVRDLIESKGRGDSATFLEFLDEENKAPLKTPVQNIVRAWGQSHRSAAAQAVRELLIAPQSLPVTSYNLNLLGAVINFKEGSISISENRMPKLSRLMFTVKEVTPKRQSVRKRELMDNIGQGVADRNDMVMVGIREDIDFAIYMEQEKAAAKTLIINVLTLYNDGESPGVIWSSPNTDMAEFQLQLLNEVMFGPSLRVASTEVQEAFMDYQDQLKQLAFGLPEGVPDPFDQQLIQETRQGTIDQIRGELTNG